MKLLSTKYKTHEGALKRAAFERGVNPGEVRRGFVAAHKRFWVLQDAQGFYRVAWERILVEG